VGPEMSSSDAKQEPLSPMSAFFAGLRASYMSVFVFVLVGTYVGMAALAQEYGFSLGWLMASTVLVWAGPSQVILISALGTGATLVETAIAVGLSCVRFLPMVVALLPLMRGPRTRTRDLLLPAHFTAASMWVESFRLLPGVPPERRVIYCNGLGVGFMSCALLGCIIGYFLTASLPPLLTAAMLFLTPMSFLISTARNARTLADRSALALGLIILPLLVYADVGLDLMWTGIIAGTAAYGIHRWRGARP
jgi:predicted branched-subunit amino acid permease